MTTQTRSASASPRPRPVRRGSARPWRRGRSGAASPCWPSWSSVALLFEPLVFTAYGVTLGRVALIGLVALGLTVVILMGELDLSVASTLVLSGVVMAMIPNLSLGIVAALAIGLVVGAVNAFFVVKVGINSFIATLGMLFVLRGLAFVLSDEKPVPLTDIDAGIRFGTTAPRVRSRRGSCSSSLVFVLLQVFVTRMRAGREFYAVGGNRQAAHDAGIPVDAPHVHRVHDLRLRRRRWPVSSTPWSAPPPTRPPGRRVLLSSIAAAIIGGVALTAVAARSSAR